MESLQQKARFWVEIDAVGISRTKQENISRVINHHSLLVNILRINNLINNHDNRTITKREGEISMDGKDFLKLHNQFTTLKEVAEEYPNKTIENIIVQMEARRKEIENAH